VYAYLLVKGGDYIDFVSMQFYESYSRAGMEILHYKMSPGAYIEFYVKDLVVSKKESFFVDFDTDSILAYPSRYVQFPLSKLVLGFANGWGADNNDDKICYFEPVQIINAYKNLLDANLSPQGFMYWVM
jgi:beta-glucosidase